jgi:hypothetical protein
MNPFRKAPIDENCPKSEAPDDSFARYTVGMKSSDLRTGTSRPRTDVPGKAPWVRGLVCLVVLTFMSLAVGSAQQQIGNGLPYPPPTPGVIPMNRTANPTADANRLMEDSLKQQANLKRFDEINKERRKEMTSDIQKLVELANQLKSATNQVTPDTTSVLEIRRAEAIEKLAHSVQHKMKVTAAN